MVSAIDTALLNKSQSVTIKWIELLLHVWEVTGSIISPSTVLLLIFPSIQSNAEGVP
jgi:hypothetical protein